MPLGPEGEPVRAEHCAILGDSGSGKDTLGRYVAEETDTPVLTALDKTYPGPNLTDTEAIRNAVQEGRDCVVVKDTADEIANTMVNVAVDNGPVTLVFPEASNYLYEPDEKPAKQHNAVWWALTEGRDKGIKVVMTEQDPSDLPYTPLKQVPWIAWCGAPSGFSRGFFNHAIGNWIPKNDLPVREHHYTVFHKSGHTVFPEQGTAETPIDYA